MAAWSPDSLTDDERAGLMADLDRDRLARQRLTGNVGRCRDQQQEAQIRAAIAACDRAIIRTLDLLGTATERRIRQMERDLGIGGEPT